MALRSRRTTCELAWRSPVLRAGAFMPGAATVQPAVLARGLRRVAARARRGHPRRDDGHGAGRRAARLVGRGRRLRDAAPAGRRGRPDARSASGRRRPLGDGQVLAGAAVVALNAWAAAWPSVRAAAGDVVELHRPDRADPGPSRRDRLDRRRGPAPTAGSPCTTCGRRPTGASRIGGGGGRAGFGGRIGPAFTDDAQSTARAAAGLRRLFPSLRDVRIEDAWGGPIDITADHLPIFASVPGRPIHFGHGYSGNGVAPSVVGGRILAALAVEAA